MASIRLISFDICPFVERSRIVLHEKGVAFDQSLIDLDDKPDWFLAISPRGKVPVLVVDEQPIFESSVINEFLEEYIPEPAMLPDDIVARAQARAWIAYNNEAVLPALGKLWFNVLDEQKVEEARAEIEVALARLEEHLAARAEGPFFMGARFGLVDASLAPNFTRLEACDNFGHGDLLANFPHLTRYANLVLEHPSVQRARAAELTAKMIARMQRR